MAVQFSASKLAELVNPCSGLREHSYLRVYDGSLGLHKLLLAVRFARAVR